MTDRSKPLRRANRNYAQPFRRMLALTISWLLCCGGVTGALAQEDAQQSGQSSKSSTQATKEFSFNIPAQPIAPALDAFASKTDWQIGYPSEPVAEIVSPGVTGRHSAAQALRMLLAGTGFTYRLTGIDTVTLERQLVQQSTVPSNQPPLSGNSGGTVTLPLVTVTESVVEEEYNVPNATTGTKTDTPIMETPFSVQVVPRQVLDDQQVTRVKEALSNVSGVTTLGSSGGRDIYNIRGFATDTIYRNGVLSPELFGAHPNRRETANLESISVLKGPGSVLYGRSAPGGIIDLITKKPLADPFYSLQQQFGSFDFYRTTLDATGPISKDDRLLYRFNLAYENLGSFRDFQESERIFLAPTLQWNISPRLEAGIELEYSIDDYFFDSGIPVFGDRPAPVPRSRDFADPFSFSNDSERLLVVPHWSYKFNDSWTLRQTVQVEINDSPELAGVFFTGEPVTPDGTLNRGQFNSEIFLKQYFTNIDLTGKFEAFGLKHTLLLGGDYYREETDLSEISSTAPPINIFNPVFRDSSGPLVDAFPPFVIDNTTDRYGLNVQDQVELPHNLFALAGLRYDNVERRDNLTGVTTQRDDRVTPRAGLLWRPIPALSLYGSYTSNFGDSNGIDSDGNPLPPQTAEQFGRENGTLGWPPDGYGFLLRSHAAEPCRA